MCVNISSIKRIFSNQSHYFPDIPCIINEHLPTYIWTRIFLTEQILPQSKIPRILWKPTVNYGVHSSPHFASVLDQNISYTLCVRTVLIWRPWYRASLLYSFKYNQQDVTFIQYSLLLSMLYMFQAVFPPVIRSSNCTYSVGELVLMPTHPR